MERYPKSINGAVAIEYDDKVLYVLDTTEFAKEYFGDVLEKCESEIETFYFWSEDDGVEEKEVNKVYEIVEQMKKRRDFFRDTKEFSLTFTNGKIVNFSISEWLTATNEKFYKAKEIGDNAI